MRWINCGKRFPEDWQYVIIRHKPTKTIITEQNVSEAQSDWFDMENGVDYDYVDCEWLDESDESPSSDPAEVLVKALEEIRDSPVPYNERENLIWIEVARAKATDALQTHEQLKQHQ